MNIREEILKEHSKKQSEKIADYIGKNVTRFNELAKLFLSGDYRLTQRAAWIISFCAERHPALIVPHLTDFIAYAEYPPHVAVKRNVIRVLDLIDIPEDIEGQVYDLCVNAIQGSKEDIAVRAYAMSVVTHIASKYPELKVEVCGLLQDFVSHESAALRSRSKKMMKKLGCEMH